VGYCEGPATESLLRLSAMGTIFSPKYKPCLPSTIKAGLAEFLPPGFLFFHLH
jgi:hypothetical protein